MESNESVSSNCGDLTTGEHDRPVVRALALCDITVDETVQARAQMLGEDVVEEYAAAMREGDKFPALVVFQQGGTYVLADGFTRHAAAKRAALTTFECVVHAGGLRDAMLYAFGANASNGRPRSAADKRSAVLKMLADDTWCHWSNNRIAQLCRVSHQLVGEVRSATCRATSEVTYHGRYGVGTMNTGRIGKPSKDSGLAESSDSLPASANENETDAISRTAASVETAPTAVTLTDKSAVDDEGQVYADQHVGSAAALAVLAEFLNFVLARIDRQGKNLIVTIVEQDADEFRCLWDRAVLDPARPAKSTSCTTTGRSSRRSKIDLREGDLMMNYPLPRPLNPYQYDGLGRNIEWRHLVTAASLREVSSYLGTFDSYARTEAMTYLMIASSPRRALEIFMDSGNDCDAPWPYRGYLAAKLRDAINKVALIDLLEPPERAFYSALPDLVPVWRGCERGRVRGLSWTTDRMVAEGFALGKRCRNAYPTLMHAEIPKPHIFGVFLNRKESELALDPRRLRNLRQEPFTAGDA
jgi:hypothetical protein